MTFIIGTLTVAAEKGTISHLALEEEAISKHSLEMAETLDGYLMQTLVESRYQSATSVVWVYGCADKT